MHDEPIRTHLVKSMQKSISGLSYWRCIFWAAGNKLGRSTDETRSPKAWLVSMDSSRILVTGFPDDTTETELVIYFQSTRDSGGGDVESIKIDQGRAEISFEDVKGIEIWAVCWLNVHSKQLWYNFRLSMRSIRRPWMTCIIWHLYPYRGETVWKLPWHFEETGYQHRHCSPSGKKLMFSCFFTFNNYRTRCS